MSERLSEQYTAIKEFAQKKATELRSTYDLPLLPSDEELAPLQDEMWETDIELIAAVTDHLNRVGVAQGNGFEDHIEKVAILGAHAAQTECNIRQVPRWLHQEIIQRSWRLGLLHDIERWRGYGKDHMIIGSEVAGSILDNLGIQDNFLVPQVLLHDELEVGQLNKAEFDIPFFSLFAVDHLNWGLEWEGKKWEVLSQKNVPIDRAVIDYKTKHLDLLKSPNLQQTYWGREIVVPYVQFGIEIAKSVEKEFGR